jgi:hypothetical protein
MPAKTRYFGHFDARFLAIIIEKTELHPVGDL